MSRCAWNGAMQKMFALPSLHPPAKLPPVQLPPLEVG